MGGQGTFTSPVSRVRAFVCASRLRGVSPPRARSRLRVSRVGNCGRVPCEHDAHHIDTRRD